MAEKLKGKGRVKIAKLKDKGGIKKERQIVFLPPTPKGPETEEPKPSPGEPTKIWGGIGRTLKS